MFDETQVSWELAGAQGVSFIYIIAICNLYASELGTFQSHLRDPVMLRHKWFAKDNRWTGAKWTQKKRTQLKMRLLDYAKKNRKSFCDRSKQKWLASYADSIESSHNNAEIFISCSLCLCLTFDTLNTSSPMTISFTFARCPYLGGIERR